jgi:hypothetical protein
MWCVRFVVGTKHEHLSKVYQHLHELLCLELVAHYETNTKMSAVYKGLFPK